MGKCPCLLRLGQQGLHVFHCQHQFAQHRRTLLRAALRRARGKAAQVLGALAQLGAQGVFVVTRKAAHRAFEVYRQIQGSLVQRQVTCVAHGVGR
jgi:hypothetical protein